MSAWCIDANGSLSCLLFINRASLATLGLSTGQSFEEPRHEQRRRVLVRCYNPASAQRLVQLHCCAKILLLHLHETELRVEEALLSVQHFQVTGDPAGVASLR